MTRAYIAGTFCFGLACCAFAPLAQVETIIMRQWDNTELTQDKCLERTEAAICGTEFKTLPHTATSRHGARGACTMAVRCLVDKAIVFFIVAGPSRATGKYSTKIVKHF